MVTLFHVLFTLVQYPNNEVLLCHKRSTNDKLCSCLAVHSISPSPGETGKGDVDSATRLLLYPALITRRNSGSESKTVGMSRADNSDIECLNKQDKTRYPWLP